jgi:hypothetical protein
MIPDYRQDTGAEAFDRVAPRVLVALLGLVVASMAFWFQQQGPALYNFIVVGVVLVFLGVRGFWLPFVRPSQLVVAGWLAVSTPIFGVRGAALWLTLAVAVALVVITVVSGSRRITSP